MAVNKIWVNTAGKDRLFRFDMYAMEVFCNDEGFKGQFAYIARMLHAGLSAGCYALDKENDFSKEDILDMIDELALTNEGQEKLKQINDCMAQSQAFKSLIEKSTSAGSPTETVTEPVEVEKKSLLNGTGSTPLRLEKSA